MSGGGVVGHGEHRRREQEGEEPAHGAGQPRPTLRPDQAGPQWQADSVVSKHKQFGFNPGSRSRQKRRQRSSLLFVGRN